MNGPEQHPRPAGSWGETRWWVALIVLMGGMPALATLLTTAWAPGACGDHGVARFIRNGMKYAELCHGERSRK
jgi:hypothetical protein